MKTLVCFLILALIIIAVQPKHRDNPSPLVTMSLVLCGFWLFFVSVGELILHII